MRVFKFEHFLFILSLFFLNSAFAEEREGKAVYEISSEKGMRISEEGLKNIEVETKKVSAASDMIVSDTALVQFQDNTGVYRLRDNWFKLVPIKIIKKNKTEIQIQSSDLLVGDQIAIKGAALLRVAEMDAFGGGE